MVAARAIGLSVGITALATWAAASASLREKPAALMLPRVPKAGKRILLEGQLGAMKDTDHGIYPMVTSSSPIAGYGTIGAGVPPYEIKEIVAVTKAYSSAVGAGAFVSEIFDKEAELLRNHGGA